MITSSAPFPAESSKTGTGDYVPEGRTAES